MKLTVNPEYEALLPKLPKEEYEALKQSIKSEGQHFLITVNMDGVILDGHHRFKVCSELGIEPKYEVKKFPSVLHEKKFVIEANLRRRQLTIFQRVEMAIPLLEIEKELAKERQLAGKTLSSNELKGQARDIVASKVGVSATTFQRATVILEKGSEKLKEKTRKGKVSISFAYQTIKTAEKHETPPLLPKGEFDVLYADPPWKYKYVALDGNAETQYPTMQLKDICDLEIPSAKDAILFLWATNPLLQEALEVIKAWGFTYKTNIVWIKNGLGVGHYVRGDHELLLIGKKGNMPIPISKSRPSSVLKALKSRHSKKPTEVYNIIESMYPNRKYFELFARKKREGWTTWGNEI